MLKETRVALVGCGWAARNLHLPALRRAGGAQLVAAADPNERNLAGIESPQEFTDIERMLGTVECDAVIIASPPTAHLCAVEWALRAGRAVLLEKPPAATRAEAHRILEIAAASSLLCVPALNQRHHPELVRLKRRMKAGEFGDIEAVNVVWTSGSALSPRAWLRRREQGGGAMLDLGIHVTDLWRWLLDSEVEGIRATGRSEWIDDQTVAIHGRSASGTLVSAVLSLASTDRFDIEVIGKTGSARVFPYRRMKESYTGQWRAFESALAGGRWTGATLAEGVAALDSMLDAAMELPLAPRWDARPVEYPLSLVCSTTRDYDAIRTTVSYLRRQTIASKLELILVGPSEAALCGPAAETEAFGAVQRIGIGEVRSIAHANAAGVRAARGRLVVFTEDHCFPEPEWAEALVAAHEGPYAVVGPVMRNGNPDTLVSWCDFLIGYGPWMEPMAACSPDFLPGHNSCYKRDILLELGGRMEALLEAETVLHYELSANGIPLRVEPAARARHINYSRLSVWIPVQLLCGRLFGGSRAMAWSWKRKWFYAAASPLIPAVRLWRCAREMHKPGRSRALFWKMLPLLSFGLVLDGIGQMAGYLWGAGDSMRRLAFYEFNRADHVKLQERALWTSAS
ncbi:Gfo/Idh/MocA family protein [Paludibaculum fermentans]|uniref:Gfo/Idh/MocA family protein n=1 Tax=Paludibaculum fermentans TaxID=1473598 RepID=UPI003EBE7EA5